MNRSSWWYASKAGRKDKNHAAVKAALTKAGYLVIDTSGSTGGIPDLCVYGPRTNPVWLEIKYKKGGLTPAQKKWHSSVTGTVEVHIVRTPEEAIAAVEKGLIDG